MLWAVAMALPQRGRPGAALRLVQAGWPEERFSKVIGRGFAIAIGAGTAGVIIGGVLAAWTSMAFTVQVELHRAGASPCSSRMAMVEPHVEHERPPYLENLKRGFTFAWRTPQVRYTVLLGSTVMMAAFAPVILIQPFLIEHDVATRPLWRVPGAASAHRGHRGHLRPPGGRPDGRTADVRARLRRDGGRLRGALGRRSRGDVRPVRGAVPDPGIHAPDDRHLREPAHARARRARPC